jgi:hypothetical protein
MTATIPDSRREVHDTIRTAMAVFNTVCFMAGGYPEPVPVRHDSSRPAVAAAQARARAACRADGTLASIRYLSATGNVLEETGSRYDMQREAQDLVWNGVPVVLTMGDGERFTDPTVIARMQY